MVMQEKKELDQSSSKDIDLGAPLPKPSGNYMPRPPPTNTVPLHTLSIYLSLHSCTALRRVDKCDAC